MNTAAVSRGSDRTNVALHNMSRQLKSLRDCSPKVSSAFARLEDAIADDGRNRLMRKLREAGESWQHRRLEEARFREALLRLIIEHPALGPAIASDALLKHFIEKSRDIEF